MILLITHPSWTQIYVTWYLAYLRTEDVRLCSVTRLEIPVFLDMMRCRLISSNWRFGEACSLDLQSDHMSG